ncbi:acyltransferase family protein [Sphingomonas crusticola]|uniref:acyltransferase family protein n=1 Tax=Sphingomonas crusticola TaxID=1697973 RepID=UPI000E27E29F|nr:acyltransferase family protein [Sphingomonas crusticola]
METGRPAHRHYGMDWLRIGAFQLLILYHVGMAFVPWAFSVKMTPPIDWTVVPMFLTNPWRLSLLFVVSGFASAALFARSPSVGALMRSRLARLGIPLLFGMAVIVTPQPWVELVTQHGYSHGFGYFLLHDYYRPQAIDGVIVPTYMHLWFVVYLLAYTLLWGALLTLPGAWKERAKRVAERSLAGPALLPIGITAFFCIHNFVSPGWSDTHLFVNDWSAHLDYFSAFLFGILLRHSHPVRAAVARWWKIAGIAALLGWAYLAWAELAYPGDARLSYALSLLYRIARSTEAWGAIVALIGLAETHWNHDSKWRPMLAEAVFPFYIVHQTLILVVGYWLLSTPTTGLERFLILVVATFAGCWLFYLIGRNIAPLRPLIGLKRQTATKPVSAGHVLV